MLEKTEDEISAECLRILALHELCRDVRRVPIIPMGPSGTPNNWTYGVVDPRLDTDAARVAHELIMNIAERWIFKE